MLAMQYRGDDQAGFSVALDEPTRTVRISAWGFWGPDLATAFSESVTETCRAARQAARLVLDATKLKPQRDAGQAAFGAVMSALPRLGITEASVKTSNALTKLQLLRIAKESTANALVLHFDSGM